jgi:transcription antitermination protein NusB
MVSQRSRAREVALQLLYQCDLNPTVARKVIEDFVRDRLPDANFRPFALALYDGVVENKEEIDRQLTAAAENWRLPRMAAVDRNVLRLGSYELLHTPETPGKVALDEAIEMARRYGSANSPAFINGVLDRLLQNARAVS